MPPKVAKGPKAKQKPQEEQREELLQAVVRSPNRSSHCSVSDSKRFLLILSKTALRPLPLNVQEYEFTSKEVEVPASLYILVPPPTCQHSPDRIYS